MNQDIKHIVVSSAAAETIAMVQNEATRELKHVELFSNERYEEEQEEQEDHV